MYKKSIQQIKRLVTFVFVLCAIGGFSVPCRAQNVQITLSLKDATLKKSIDEIEKQTKYLFVYNEECDLQTKVTITVVKQPLRSVLDQIFRNTPITYRLEGSNIILSQKSAEMLQPTMPSRPQTINGRVTDSAGQPIVGASVIVKGTTVGVSTDVNGKYSIRVPDQSAALQIMSLGYETLEIVPKSRTVLDVTLKSSAQKIDEVVVTALGITRKEKSLGYAVSKVSNEELNNTVSGNWLNGLNGKVAGLNFDQASAGPGGSVRVTLRGEASLSHDNNTALFVIDGVPISSDMTGSTSGGSYDNQDAPVDYGNGASDLNPEDIESISVLKGPAATALYGSRAANGAIVITTKSGGNAKSKGLNITFNSSCVLESAGFWPDFQTEYGAGNANASQREQMRNYSFWNVAADLSDTGEKISRTHSTYSYGAQFEGQMFYNYDSAVWSVDDNGAWKPTAFNRTKWVARDWYKGAFETGVTWSNSLSIDGSMGKGNSMRISVKDVRNDWILPNTGYTSQNVSLSINQKAGKYVKLGAKATYYRKDSENLPMSGYSAASPLYTLLWNNASIDVASYYDEWASGRLKMLLKDYYDNNKNSVYIINRSADNLYLQLYEQLNTMDRDRVYGNVNATFQILPSLSLMVRTGVDFQSDFRTQRKPKYSYNYKDGLYKEQTVRQYEMNNDFLLSWKQTFGDFDINASFGGNNMVQNYQNVQIIADKLFADDVYNLQNSLYSPTIRATRREKSINSFYGLISLGWRNTVYFDVTGRNDWSSTLARGNNSYFYPSVSASVLIDELMGGSRPKWLDLLKVRGSWANVGNDTTPYSLVQTYAATSFPSGYRLENQIKNSNLKPENIESWEVGLEAHFLQNRISFDAAYYDSSTTNQIISVPIDPITNANYKLINAGEVNNHGVELSASFTPVKTKKIRWTINVNWAKNWNKLVELAPNVEFWQLNNSNTYGNRVYIRAYPGTELGRIYGTGFKRAPEGAFYTDTNGNRIDCAGQLVINPDNGCPVLGNELMDLGSIYPQWTGGFNTNFSWRNFRLSASFSASYGGKAFSISDSNLSRAGKLTNTLEGRYDGLMIPGVKQMADGTYTPNDMIVTDVVDYYTTYKYIRDNVESCVYDCSYLKMKELRIEYSLPKKLCKKTHVLQGASLAFFATNLFCITDWPMYDPEVGTMNGSSISRGIESGAYPMTRSYGFNLKLQF